MFNWICFQTKQNAASKILDIADKENDARSSDAVKIAKEVMVKAGRKKVMCF